MRSLVHLLLACILALYITPTVAADSSAERSVYAWGTYRPNVYFGVRARHGSSPLFGLLWGGPFSDVQHIDSIRHDAEERDHVTKYGWLQHDGNSFGLHEILDADKHVNLTTAFLNPVNEDGSVQHDQWVAHVTLEPYGAPPRGSVDLSFFWYVAIEKGSGQSIQVVQGIQDTRENIVVDIDGAQPLRLTAHLPASSHHPTARWWSAPQKQSSSTWTSPRFLGLDVQDSWNAKHHIRDALMNAAQQQYQHLQKPGDKPEDIQHRVQASNLLGLLPNNIQPHSTLLVFQHIVTLPYSLTFSLEPHVAPLTFSQDSIRAVIAHLPARSAAFSTRFAEAFPLTSAFASPSHLVFAQAALANLVGGIGYFHGSSLIESSKIVTVKDKEGKEKKKKQVDTKQTAALSLLSCVPSRSFFPRGFLWDEGFHQLLVGQVDLELSLDVLSSWLSHILPSGWLPREQIPGEEARKRVPAEFQVQKPHIANPPVLVLSIGRLVTRLQDRQRRRETAGKAEIGADGTVKADVAKEDTTLDADVARLTAFIESVYPALQRHADWYYHTQSAVTVPKEGRVGASRSLSSPTTFRWAGRTLTHCLASGLDDYPRAPFVSTAKDAFKRGLPPGEPPVSALHEGEGVEGHVDLHSWMIALATTMSHLAGFLHAHAVSDGGPDWALLRDEYRAKAEQLLDRLDALHWNEDNSMYCDYAYHHGHHHHICHLGYISLLPLFLGHIDPQSTRFTHLLTQLTSPSLYTEHGLRSLSSSDAKYATAEDYWRGHIWINFNFLACQALAHYGASAHKTAKKRSPSVMDRVWESLGISWRRDWPDGFDHLLDHVTPRRWVGGEEGEVGRVYEELRTAVVNNVYDNYQRKGFLYENYNSTNGEGRGSHPFTGWTALVVSLMAEKY